MKVSKYSKLLNFCCGETAEEIIDRNQSYLFHQANGFRILYSGHPTPTPSIEMLLDVNDVYAPMQGGERTHMTSTGGLGWQKSFALGGIHLQSCQVQKI